MELDTKQLAAVDLCADLSKRLVGITGQAGTGKTTIIRMAAAKLIEAGKTVAVAAPTGKAARRIKEATDLPATTVHKLLEYPRPGEFDAETGKPLDTTHPRKCKDDPLYYDAVFVDEYAMVNYELHNNLIAALKPGGALRCFGDINQLPPIEEYKIKTDSRTPFMKILEDFPSVTLDTVFRQAEGSDILAAATRIRMGNIPQKLEDFKFHATERPNVALPDAIMISLERGVDFRLIQNQVITPGRKSWMGTHKLNVLIQGLLNPYQKKDYVDLPRNKWDEDNPVRVSVGDKVVCTENTYDLRSWEQRFEEWTDNNTPVVASYIPCPDTKMMLNGETGVITVIHEDGSLEIDFGDRTVEVPSTMYEYWEKQDSVIEVDPRKKIDLAYALTTHKCQGSEFDNVIYVMNKSMSYNQNRQNFYTAVTRAKKKVLVITDQGSLVTSVRKKA